MATDHLDSGGTGRPSGGGVLGRRGVAFVTCKPLKTQSLGSHHTPQRGNVEANLDGDELQRERELAFLAAVDGLTEGDANLPCEERRNGVADLARNILLRADKR